MVHCKGEALPVWRIPPPPPSRVSIRKSPTLRVCGRAMAVESGEGPAKDVVSGLALSTPPLKPSADSHDEIRAVARKFADQPVQNPDPDVWAVLTAISKNARQRPQGMNIILRADEHCLGRCVEETQCQISEIAISSNHCKIFRDRTTSREDGLDSPSVWPVYLKDTSTNGTYLNWSRLRKISPPARLKHGDIISFVAPPHETSKSFAFVYREVSNPIPVANSVLLKRKSGEEFSAENKRSKGIGIGAPDGPVSLDDVRSLQRANTNLRQQLESHVLTIETLRNESRSAVTHHENELKELKENLSNSLMNQIQELQCVIDEKKKEVESVKAVVSELENSMKDLNERLSVSMQSRIDADEIIHSQKATISELEAQLEEERNLRREEREQAAANLKIAVQKVQSEAQEEIRRQTDIHMKQQKEQQEVINKLQDSEKENRLLVETLRSKLEDSRESLVMSEKKVRQLEVQLKDEQLTSAKLKEKAESLESELSSLRKELENEKVAREEAWAKVSALELEIAAAIRDLSTEKQRFQGARERIILRETQLRAFYSTTEEISALFAKQQEQLKAMQRTLEDEEHCENSYIGFNLKEPSEIKAARKIAHESKDAKENSGGSIRNNAEAVNESTAGDGDDDDRTTENHDCGVGTQDNTQDLECTSADKLGEGFGSDINGIGTAVLPDGDPIDTEQVPGTESPVDDADMDENNAALQKCSNIGGETMQLDDDCQIKDNVDHHNNLECKTGDGSQSRLQDTQAGTVRTADLLASEAAGSWAVSTAPSVHGENESPRSVEDAGAEGKDSPAASALLLFSDSLAAASQNNSMKSASKLSDEHKMLNAMIEIVAPDFKHKFRGEEVGGNNESMSDADTDDDKEDNTNHPTRQGDSDDNSATGDDEMIEDSVG